MNDYAFERLVSEYEQLRSKEPQPSLAEFLGTIRDASLRPRLLLELICVDLEFQWKAVARGEQSKAMMLEEYVEAFTELGSLADLPLQLIEEEYRARTCWGDEPRRESFAGRFVTRKAEVVQALRRVDVELGRETSTSQTAVKSGAKRHEATTRDRAPLEYADYLLQEMLGAGRMGRVYRAVQRTMGRHVAVKFLRKKFLQNAEAVEQFIREANIVASFDHSGIVRIHGLGQTPGGGYFIAMDLIEGLDLATRIANSVVAPQEAARWTSQACLAVKHAHESGIVHCDLKPANLLVDQRNQIRVTDFGLARSVSDSSHGVARIEGTAAYMAPEQVSRWWGPIGVHTDVYGMGAVLYELLTGGPPFQGQTLTDVLSRVVSGVRPLRPELLRPELPTTLSDVCMRCLAKRPTDRYKDLAELAEALGHGVDRGTT